MTSRHAELPTLRDESRVLAFPPLALDRWQQARRARRNWLAVVLLSFAAGALLSAAIF